MALKDVLQKVIKKEELNALDIAELEAFKPVDAAAISKRAEEAEAEAAKLRKEKEDAEAATLSEVEKTKKELKKAQDDLAAAVKERDTVRGEHAALVRKNRINELATKHGCEDPEYLDFLANKGNVDLADEAKSTEFVEGMKKSSPKSFRASVPPGAEKPKADDKNAVKPDPNDRVGNVMEMLNGAPEAK